jgi:hypothetical protein
VNNKIKILFFEKVNHVPRPSKTINETPRGGGDTYPIYP